MILTNTLPNDMHVNLPSIDLGAIETEHVNWNKIDYSELVLLGLVFSYIEYPN